MGDDSRSEVARINERIKFFSTISGNLGAALLASGAARWFFGGFDVTVLLWLLVAVGLMWMGWYVLTMLEADER